MSSARRPLWFAAVVLLGFVAWVGADLWIPIVAAALLAFVLRPFVRGLEALRIPAWAGALVVVGGTLAGMAGTLYLVYAPATEAMDDLPRAAALLVYFFLVHGDTLLRRLVEVMPTLTDKKRTVDTVRAVQGDVSRYLLTITLINVALGGAVGLALLALGVENALFWGFLAGVMNFVPYLGPLIVTGALLLVGFGDAQSAGLGAALAPAAVYGLLHVVESNGLTPALLGRQFSINPVVILLWLMLWGWLWGIAGLLFGVPMLVITKVLLQRSEGLQAWATLMETRRSSECAPELPLARSAPP